MEHKEALKQQRNIQLKRERNTLLKRVEKAMEGPLIFLGFIWLILVIVDLIWGLNPVLKILSVIIWIIFIIDFIAKFILAPEKLNFLKKNWLTAISLIIPALRVVRIVRVVRLLKGANLIKIVASVNRSMKSLSATFKRRGFGYVVALTIGVIFAGAAGMYAFENQQSGGLKTYGEALWWTAMLITSLGSQYWPVTAEGQALCLLLALYGFCVFGYITATLASFFVGRDAEEKDAPIAGAEDVKALQKKIDQLTQSINELKAITVANQQQ
ncbi:two pore domain potassium channel family protein [Ilyomonas limi]|uniref:Two pore domain potassium channel family protein n=1 Tax=Ilyomonas limi TaxID=2575867 RepID=A0A4V5UTM2_9BACT|nr:ion transporter [Ilyomonas limi]TKK65673.1 two pore domain potassium channel family protein [Ilyomonas limi]